MLAIQGRIDHGHHENEAQRALEQTLELDKAVSAALDLVDLEVIAHSLNLQDVQEKINQAGLMKNILAGDLDNSNSGPLPRSDSEWLPGPRFKYSRGNRGRRRSHVSHFDVQV